MSLRFFCNYVPIYVSCGELCAGIVCRRAFLIPTHLPLAIERLDIPAKQYNSWLRGTKNPFHYLSDTEGIQKNSEEFRRNLHRIQTMSRCFQTEFRYFQTEFRQKLDVLKQNLNLFQIKFRQNLDLDIIQMILDRIQTEFR